MSSGPALVSILRQGSYLVASVHTALDDTEMVRFRNDLVVQCGLNEWQGVVKPQLTVKDARLASGRSR